MYLLKILNIASFTSPVGKGLSRASTDFQLFPPFLISSASNLALLEKAVAIREGTWKRGELNHGDSLWSCNAHVIK